VDVVKVHEAGSGHCNKNGLASYHRLDGKLSMLNGDMKDFE
jgi:hypothetical protein